MLPSELETKHLSAILPLMRYEGGNAAIWQSRARARLIPFLGKKPEKCKPELKILAKGDTGTCHVTRFTFQSEDDYAVPCVLAVPNTGKAPFPLMICLQGHSTGMHISFGRARFPGDESLVADGDRDFARQALAHGFAALTVEMRCMGECGAKPNGSPNCMQTAMTALLTGRTLLGERVYDVMRAIDLMRGFKEVDMNRIACMGNSGGGTVTTYLAALDKRVKAAIPSCAVCRYDRSIGAMEHCACNYLPGIARYFDMGDICGLIAPRPLIVVSGKNDPIFLLDGAISAVEQTRRVYEALDARDKMMQVIGEGGHRFYADIAWDAFARLAPELFPQE